mmetsp:Transcript_46660/g.77176  ORF Transcript_46660/g.77176 Transcript_46660/m.77176 type:complete len:301 (-) Transcript_46660:400-1302(-)|eukprot:CAMPEP_0119324700 /NCGR_PEP_ID=MMETSP1333-20130426/63955_1 /TAXON_ID=418940 /ORGANISM="Scyphosphaera apsteinii, Strain RCC1455" /LENGTH=300 /DNA_ID=CAMNT_0007332477 /DNA_START=55 /DNA_END=957 /DNA_ORIENTATION=-
MEEWKPDLRLMLVVFCLAIFQAVLWGWIYSADGPLVRPIAKWIEKRPARRLALVTNAQPFFESYGVQNEQELVTMWVSAYLMIPLHHGLCGAFALLAAQLGSADCFRLALSFEIGEDVLHYAQMGWTLLRPQCGISPWKYADVYTWAFVGCHHLLGLIAGTAACLYTVSEWEEVHIFVAWILVAGLPAYLTAPLQLIDSVRTPSALGLTSAFIDSISLSFMVWVRLWYFLPAALSLVQRGFELGGTTGYIFAVPLLGVAPVFNVASVAFYGAYVFARLREQAGTRGSIRRGSGVMETKAS